MTKPRFLDFPDNASWYRARAKFRRALLGEQKLCLNGESHGPATHGVRCAWCHAVHRFGVVVAFRMGIARPPNHRVTRRLTAGAK